jgi:hypothetical protein
LQNYQLQQDGAYCNPAESNDRRSGTQNKRTTIKESTTGKSTSWLLTKN